MPDLATLALFAAAALALCATPGPDMLLIASRSVSQGKASGFATLAAAVFFLSGVQLVSLGIVGEYVGRIFDEVKQRPGYLIAAEGGVGARPLRPGANAPQGPTA